MALSKVSQQRALYSFYAGATHQLFTFWPNVNFPFFTFWHQREAVMRGCFHGNWWRQQKVRKPFAWRSRFASPNVHLNVPNVASLFKQILSPKLACSLLCVLHCLRTRWNEQKSREQKLCASVAAQSRFLGLGEWGRGCYGGAERSRRHIYPLIPLQPSRVLDHQRCFTFFHFSHFVPIRILLFFPFLCMSSSRYRDTFPQYSRNIASDCYR